MLYLHEDNKYHPEKSVTEESEALREALAIENKSALGPWSSNQIHSLGEIIYSYHFQ